MHNTSRGFIANVLNIAARSSGCISFTSLLLRINCEESFRASEEERVRHFDSKVGKVERSILRTKAAIHFALLRSVLLLPSFNEERKRRGTYRSVRKTEIDRRSSYRLRGDVSQDPRMRTVTRHRGAAGPQTWEKIPHQQPRQLLSHATCNRPTDRLSTSNVANELFLRGSNSGLSTQGGLRGFRTRSSP